MKRAAHTGLIVLVWLVSLVAIAVALVAFNRMSLAEWFVRSALEGAGYPKAVFTITELTKSRSVAENVILGPDGPKADRIELSYALGELFRGKISSFHVAGAAVTVDLDAPREGGGEPFALDLSGLEKLGAAISFENALLTVTGGPVGRLALKLSADADFSQDDAPIEIALDGSADTHALRLNRLSLKAARVRGEQDLTFSGTLEADIEYWNIGTLRIETLSYSGEVGLAGAGTKARLRLSDPLRGVIIQGEAGTSPVGMADISAPSLAANIEWGEKSATADLEFPSLAVLAEDMRNGAFVRADLKADRTLLSASHPDRGESSLQAQADGARFSVLTGTESGVDAEVRAVGSAGRIEASAASTAGWDGTLSLYGGAVALTGAEVNLEAVNAFAPFTDEGLGGEARISARVYHAARNPAFMPARIEATLRPGHGMILMSGTTTTEKEAASVSFEGQFALADGAADLKVGPNAIVFAPNGLQPADLSPLLSDLQDAKGTVMIDGRWTHRPGQPEQSSARIGLQDLDGSYLTVRAAGLNGTIEVADLTNPRTRKPQVLTARALKTPIPLEAPSIRFEIVRGRKAPLIRIESAQGGFAEGRVLIENTDITPQAAKQEIVLKVEQLSLKSLFDDYTAHRLTGSGTVSGRIPVTLEDGNITIRDGLIGAVESGVLQVNWGDARKALSGQGEQVDLLVRVLEDFHYDVLEVALNRPPGQQLTLQVRLQGNNPAVLEGYPFNLNIGLSGNLETLLGALAQGQELTMDLLRSRLDGSN